MDEPNGATRGRTERTYPAFAGDSLTSALRADLGQRARAAQPLVPKSLLADAEKLDRAPDAPLRPRFALSPESPVREPENTLREAASTVREAAIAVCEVEPGPRAVESRSPLDELAGHAAGPGTSSDEPHACQDAEAPVLRAFEARPSADEAQRESARTTEGHDRASSDTATLARTTAHGRPEESIEVRELAPPLAATNVRATANAPERTGSSAPTIAVVVPTLDEERLLPLLLDRLFDRAGDHDLLDRADEVVVADGESRDRTREIARERGATVVRACASRGVQLATGAHASSADVLLFLHADCVPRRGAIARVRRAFEDESVLATAMHQEIESAGLLYRCIERCADLRSRLGLVWGDSGLAVRRDVYEAVGGFGPYEIFEDVDLSLRLRRAGRIRFLADATLGVSARRWHSEGALRCTLRNWELCTRFLLGADPNALARSYRKCAAV